jgi:hypothetical protein
MREKLLIIGVLVLLATPAGAWPHRRNARLDLVFGPGEKERLVLFVDVHEHYFFLTARWMDEGDREAAAFLPLFRVVEQNTRHAPADHWRHGIWPLLCAGTREDLKILHGDYRARLDRPGDSGERQWLLLGMGRVLGLHLPVLKSRESATREAEQYRQVRDALKREGLLD